ncbi:MAG: metallophosphoesterase [Gemmatales bacterium]
MGDLHGHLANFKQVLQLAKLGEYPRRHVVLQELVHGPFRYPGEGGELSHRLVDVVSAYICQYPGRVHYLLGNHELAQWTRREIAKNNESLNNLFVLGVCTAYPEHTEAMLQAYDELFESLPVAIRLPNRVFLSHSLPGASRLETWTLDQLQKESFAHDDYKLGGCVHSVVWGRDTSEETVKKYLELVESNLLISGHIPTDQGYETPNPQQVILDGKDENAYVLLFPTKEPLTQEQLLKHLIKLNDKS